MNCSICGKPLNILFKQKLSDGAVCKNCASVSTPLSSATFNVKSSSVALLKSYHGYCNRCAEDSKRYKHTRIAKKFISIDSNNKLWRLETDKKYKSDIFLFSELRSFELLEDGVSTSKISLGGAVAGGFLFGGIGAIIGGLGKEKKVVDSMSIKITLSNPFVSTLEIKLFENMSAKTTSAFFKENAKKAEEILSILEQIQATVAAEANIPVPAAQSSPAHSESSLADEVQKLKSLLDSGAIDEEEFKAMKQKLLS